MYIFNNRLLNKFIYLLFTVKNNNNTTITAINNKNKMYFYCYLK